MAARNPPTTPAIASAKLPADVMLLSYQTVKPNRHRKQMSDQHRELFQQQQRPRTHRKNCI